MNENYTGTGFSYYTEYSCASGSGAKALVGAAIAAFTALAMVVY